MLAPVAAFPKLQECPQADCLTGDLSLELSVPRTRKGKSGTNGDNHVRAGALVRTREPVPFHY